MTAPNPAIVLVSEHHMDTLQDEFGRYARDYDLHTATSAREAAVCTRQVLDAGGQVAMFVTESVLPDIDIHHAFHKLRELVPTARRVVAAHWERFLTDAPRLRVGLATGKYDAYLLMPRGVRDEEFHNAITDLLSDWGATVPDPEVVSVKIISPVRDQLTLAIREFLDRMGMPNRVWEPDSEAGRHVIDLYGGEPDYPLVLARTARRSWPGRCATSPSTSTAPHPARPRRGRRRRDRRRGRRAWPRRCTPRRRGWPPSCSRRRRSVARRAPAR